MEIAEIITIVVFIILAYIFGFIRGAKFMQDDFREIHKKMFKDKEEEEA